MDIEKKIALVCGVSVDQNDTGPSGEKRGFQSQGQSPPVCTLVPSFPSHHFPPPILNRLMDLGSYRSPQHLCPSDFPSWIFLDLLASAGWCLHGNEVWGGRCGDKLSPFVINCHCFVLPGVCSPLSPGGGKAGQKDSATGLPPASETGWGEYNQENCLQREPRRGDYNRTPTFCGGILP